VLPRRIWSFYVEGCKHKQRNPKIESFGLSPNEMGGVGDPKKHAPPGPPRYLAERGRSALKDEA